MYTYKCSGNHLYFLFSIFCCPKGKICISCNFFHTARQQVIVNSGRKTSHWLYFFTSSVLCNFLAYISLLSCPLNIKGKQRKRDWVWKLDHLEFGRWKLDLGCSKQMGSNEPLTAAIAGKTIQDWLRRWLSIFKEINIQTVSYKCANVHLCQSSLLLFSSPMPFNMPTWQFTIPRRRESRARGAGCSYRNNKKNLLEEKQVQHFFWNLISIELGTWSGCQEHRSDTNRKVL